MTFYLPGDRYPIVDLLIDGLYNLNCAIVLCETLETFIAKDME